VAQLKLRPFKATDRASKQQISREGNRPGDAADPRIVAIQRDLFEIFSGLVIDA
jgi:hypothetical protein